MGDAKSDRAAPSNVTSLNARIRNLAREGTDKNAWGQAEARLRRTIFNVVAEQQDRCLRGWNGRGSVGGETGTPIWNTTGSERLCSFPADRVSRLVQLMPLMAAHMLEDDVTALQQHQDRTNQIYVGDRLTPRSLPTPTSPPVMPLRQRRDGVRRIRQNEKRNIGRNRNEQLANCLQLHLIVRHPRSSIRCPTVFGDEPTPTSRTGIAEGRTVGGRSETGARRGRCDRRSSRGTAGRVGEVRQVEKGTLVRGRTLRRTRSRSSALPRQRLGSALRSVGSI